MSKYVSMYKFVHRKYKFSKPTEQLLNRIVCVTSVCNEKSQKARGFVLCSSNLYLYRKVEGLRNQSTLCSLYNP